MDHPTTINKEHNLDSYITSIPFRSYKTQLLSTDHHNRVRMSARHKTDAAGTYASTLLTNVQPEPSYRSILTMSYLQACVGGAPNWSERYAPTQSALHCVD